eukprot:gene7462-7672_t
MQKRDAEEAPSPELNPLASFDVASSQPSQRAVRNQAAKSKKTEAAGADVEPLSQRLAQKRPLSASEEEKKAGYKKSNKQGRARHSAPSAVDNSDAKQLEGSVEQHASQRSKAAAGTSKSKRQGSKGTDKGDAGAVAAVPSEDIAAIFDSTAKQGGNKSAGNSNGSRDKLGGKQSSSAADDADKVLREDDGRQAVIASATAPEKPAARNKSTSRSGKGKKGSKTSDKTTPTADNAPPLAAVPAVSQSGHSRHQAATEAETGLAVDAPAPAQSTVATEGAGCGLAAKPTAAGCAADTSAAAHPKRVKKGSKSIADVNEAALHTAQEMVDAPAAGVRATDGLYAAGATGPGWSEQEQPPAELAADKQVDENMEEAAATINAAAAVDAGESAFSKLQAEYRRLYSMYDELKAQKIAEMEGLVQEQDAYIVRMGEESRQLVEHWRKEAEHQRQAAASVRAADTQRHIKQLQDSKLEADALLLQKDTLILELQAQLAERDEKLAMLSCRPDRLEAGVQAGPDVADSAMSPLTAGAAAALLAAQQARTPAPPEGKQVAAVQFPTPAVPSPGIGVQCPTPAALAGEAVLGPDHPLEHQVVDHQVVETGAEVGVKGSGVMTTRVGHARGDSAASGAVGVAVGISPAVATVAVHHLPSGGDDAAGTSPSLRQLAQHEGNKDAAPGGGSAGKPEVAGTVRKQLQMMSRSTDDSASKGGGSSPVKGLVIGPDFAFKRSPLGPEGGAAGRQAGAMRPPAPQQQQQGSNAGSAAVNAGNGTGLQSSDDGSAVGGIGTEQQQQQLGWRGGLLGIRALPGAGGAVATPPAPHCTPVAQPAGAAANRFISPWAARQQDGMQQLLSPASSTSSLARVQARQQHLGELRAALRAGLPALLVAAEDPGAAALQPTALPAAADAPPAVPPGAPAADMLPAGRVDSQPDRLRGERMLQGTPLAPGYCALACTPQATPQAVARPGAAAATQLPLDRVAAALAGLASTGQSPMQTPALAAIGAAAGRQAGSGPAGGKASLLCPAGHGVDQAPGVYQGTSSLDHRKRCSQVAFDGFVAVVHAIMQELCLELRLAKRSPGSATKSMVPIKYLCDFEPMVLDNGSIQYKHTATGFTFLMGPATSALTAATPLSAAKSTAAGGPGSSPLLLDEQLEEDSSDEGVEAEDEDEEVSFVPLEMGSAEAVLPDFLKEHFTFAPSEKPRLMKLLFQALADAAAADENDQQRRKASRSRRSGRQQQQQWARQSGAAEDDADLAAGPSAKRRRTADDGSAAVQAAGVAHQELDPDKENAVGSSSLAGDGAGGAGALGKAVTGSQPARAVGMTCPQQAQ